MGLDAGCSQGRAQGRGGRVLAGDFGDDVFALLGVHQKAGDRGCCCGVDVDLLDGLAHDGEGVCHDLVW